MRPSLVCLRRQIPLAGPRPVAAPRRALRPVLLQQHHHLSTPPPSHRRLLSSTPPFRTAAPQDPSNLPFQPLPMSSTTPTATITPDTLSEALKSKMDVTHASVLDISGGCGQSFTAVIVSPAFEGKSALQRHRLVNAALREEIKAIHAWTPRCLTPGQWEKEQGA